jgi:3,4-dihydroxy 2-butanone 4-phosphate synthase/GTP cyclohydrolase II
MVSDTIEHVRRLLADRTFTKAGLAKAADLHPNTLRDADSESWNPTADTLRAIERVLGARQAA